MKFIIALLISFVPAASLACTLDQAVFDKTRAKFDKLDVNADNRLEKEEFLAQKGKKAKKLESEWTSYKADGKGYLTKDEFVSRSHPKCIEVKK